MPRYFIEVSYKGTNYSGFQVQENAHSVQAEVENALKIVFREKVELTGSSRTDTGVHALQNFFHFDTELAITPKHTYSLNSLLPHDIAVRNIHPVAPDAHCRFDAISRQYKYFIYQKKSPFLADRGYYYPFKPDIDKLSRLANIIIGERDFSAFSKRNTQVKTFICSITQSLWQREGECLVYQVTGNRFLRGMVRGLVGTMLKTSKSERYVELFENIIASRDCTQADFSVPGHGLFLVEVRYGEGVLQVAAKNTW